MGLQVNRRDLFTDLASYYDEAGFFTYGPKAKGWVQAGPAAQTRPEAPYDEDGDSEIGSPCDVQGFYESRWYNGVKNRYQAADYPENDLK